MGKIFTAYVEIGYCTSIKVRLTKNPQWQRKVFRYVFNCKVHDKKIIQCDTQLPKVTCCR